MPDDAVSNDDAGRPPRRMTLVATVVACVLLAIYLIGLLWQWSSADSADLIWARREQLLDGLQALGFAAAGALLGTSVQSRVTRQAESRAKDAEHRAEVNQRDGEKGRALQNLIEAQVTPPTDQPVDVERGVRGPSATATDDVLAKLLDLARRYDTDH